jgi:uncharacterized protein (DUF488 family)
MNPATKPRIFTVGHGNAPFREIERILRLHRVSTVVDVRSTPYSKYAPDFRKSRLSEFTAAAGLGYRWMGDRLGGQPGGPEQTILDAGPNTGGGSPSVQAALAEVMALNATGPVALLCSERDPEHCHRSLILAPQLEALGAEVYHILPDGDAHRHQPSLGI